MRLKGIFTLAFFLSLLFAIGFIYISVSIRRQSIEHLDDMVIALVQGWESPIMTTIMKGITTIGSFVCVLIISILLLYFIYKKVHQRTDLFFYFTVLIGNVLLNQILKAVFKRARPDLHRLIQASGYSFPSGHSMTAFAMYGAVVFLLWKHIPTVLGRGVLIVFSVFMIIAIGISRIYLGVHYPSDVVGSYLFSGFWLTAAIWFYQWYKEKQYKRKKQEDA